MIAQHQTLDEQVRETAQEFSSEVIGIRYSIGHDWNGDPAIFFELPSPMMQAGQKLLQTLQEG